jgi:pimeloyl-ACP methyl ester carboxylesterase
VRRIFRWIGALALLVAALIAISAVTNLVLVTQEQSSIESYGHRVSIDGGEVNAYVTGHGDQTVVLLSGYGTTSPVLDFQPLIEELSEDFTVVVVERFGYGYSDLDVKERTVGNISSELHTALTALEVSGPYVLVAHSVAGIHTLDYMHRFPRDVSALVTIDATVPADFAIPDRRSPWERAVSTSGALRWMTMLDPSLAAPVAPASAYSEEELERLRLMTIWNYANPSLIDENNRSGQNFDAVDGLNYPKDLPVLAFLSGQTMDAAPDWYRLHEKQLEALDRSELVVLDGHHYLHWTHSPTMAETIRQFLR